MPQMNSPYAGGMNAATQLALALMMRKRQQQQAAKQVQANMPQLQNQMNTAAQQIQQQNPLPSDISDPTGAQALAGMQPG